jgi:hypothetical protein
MIFTASVRNILDTLSYFSSFGITSVKGKIWIES